LRNIGLRGLNVSSEFGSFAIPETVAAPTGLTLTTGSFVSLLKWDMPLDPTVKGWLVQRATDSGFSANLQEARVVVNWMAIDGGATAGTTYWYRVAALRDTGEQSSYTSSVNGAAPTAGVSAGGLGLTTCTTGDLLYASASNTWARRAITGTEGRFLRRNSSALPDWSTLVLPNTASQYAFLHASGTDTMAATTNPQVKHGGGTALFRLMGALSIQNTGWDSSGSSETDLASYTLPANTLNANGQSLLVLIAGSYAANSNTKTIKFKFGSTVITLQSGSAQNNNDWFAQILISRYGVDQQDICTEGATFSTTASVTYATEDDAASIVIKVTGQGSATGDVHQDEMHVYGVLAP
jgi:hypothetical protein